MNKTGKTGKTGKTNKTAKMGKTAKSASALAFERPSEAKKAASKMLADPIVRVVLEIPKSERQSLKVAAAKVGLTVREYVRAAVLFYNPQG